MKVIEARKQLDGCWRSIAPDSPEILGYQENAEGVLTKTKVLMLINLDEQGMPHAKAMTYNVSSGLERVWFCTNTSSRRAAQLMKNPATTVYCYNPETYDGLELNGRVVIENDRVIKQKCWKSFYTDTFKGGIDDPDYLILRFETIKGNCTYKGINILFEAE